MNLLEKLAKSADEALSATYGYPLSVPDSFGYAAQLGCAAQALTLFEQGIVKIEVIAQAIHKGRAIVAMAFPGQKPELQAKRLALINTAFADLPEKEKEKLSISAKAMLSAYRLQFSLTETAEVISNKGDIGEFTEVFINQCCQQSKITGKVVRATHAGTTIDIVPNTNVFLAVAQYYQATGLRYAENPF